MFPFEYYKSRYIEEYTFLEDKKKVIIRGFASGYQKIQLQKNTTITCYKNQYECILLFHYGISVYPEYREGEDLHFILVFEGLPDDCETFHLQSIPEDGGTWKVYDYERNEEDIYILKH